MLRQTLQGRRGMARTGHAHSARGREVALSSRKGQMPASLGSRMSSLGSQSSFVRPRLTCQLWDLRIVHLK